MYDRISQMEPLIPGRISGLEDLAGKVVARSAALVGQLHPESQRPVVELLRLINSYYSNLIEGHSTHPVDIERAMHNDYAAEPAKRDLQLESLAHINCQKTVEEWLLREPDLNVADSGFICRVHKQLYAQLPDELRRVKNEDTGEAIEVIGGELRQREIRVGSHIGPLAAALPAFLDRFAGFYQSDAHHGLMPIIAVAASHHRLMWIHPFLDGNGRVTRLYTDACFRRLPLPGYGLWNVSRGLARRRDDYMAALSLGDAPRRNDYDGRGNLSSEGLAQFCSFFLEVCLDQIDYMHGLLQLDSLLDRIRGYVQLRGAKVIPPPKPGLPTLKPEAAYMLQEALLRGEVTRGDIVRVSGMAERTGRMLLGQLLDEGLLVSSMPKGPVRLALPTFVAGYLFPDLYPVQVLR
ncbi:MAG: Fic family protein [Geobacteraceae bacterium]|nr:Fic family protein [Geobacteraceae bacterium]